MYNARDISSMTSSRRSKAGAHIKGKKRMIIIIIVIKKRKKEYNGYQVTSFTFAMIQLFYY